MLDQGHQIRVFRRRLYRWHQLAAREFPWRETRDPYRVMVGELLLQRTRGENVAAVYEEFIARWPDVPHFAVATEADLSIVIRPLGLAKRAKTLGALATALGSRTTFPLTPRELEDLPGVGPYVSHAVPVFAAHRNLALVDWVIARVLRRYFGLPVGRRPNADRALWDLAGEVVLSGRARDTWLAVLDLAAAVCLRLPRCPQCPLANSCAYATGVVRS
jgi:A/G-specific adenine glycosylase